LQRERGERPCVRKKRVRPIEKNVSERGGKRERSRRYGSRSKKKREGPFCVEGKGSTGGGKEGRKGLRLRRKEETKKNSSLDANREKEKKKTCPVTSEEGTPLL